MKLESVPLRMFAALAVVLAGFDLGAEAVGINESGWSMRWNMGNGTVSGATVSDHILTITWFAALTLQCFSAILLLASPSAWRWLRLLLAIASAAYIVVSGCMTFGVMTSYSSGMFTMGPFATAVNLSEWLHRMAFSFIALFVCLWPGWTRVPLTHTRGFEVV